MSDDDEGAYLFCWRVEQVTNPFAGSRDERCERCGHRVVVAPSSFALFVKHPGLRVVCSTCMPMVVRDAPHDDSLLIERAPDARHDPVRTFMQMLTGKTPDE